MASLLNFGICPFVYSVFPLGWQNAFHDKLRKYLPVYDYTPYPFPLTNIHGTPKTLCQLGTKFTPDHLFTTERRQMYKAIIEKDYKRIEEIIDNGFDLNQIVMPHLSYTALGLASSVCSLEVIHFLHQQGADLNYKMGSNGKTALHIAVESGNELSTKLLLNKGADMNIKDKFGFDVYDKAEFRGHYNLFRIFEHFKNNTSVQASKSPIEMRKSYNEKRFRGPFKVETLHDKIGQFRPLDVLEIHYNKRFGNLFNFENFRFFFINADNCKHNKNSDNKFFEYGTSIQANEKLRKMEYLYETLYIKGFIQHSYYMKTTKY